MWLWLHDTPELILATWSRFRSLVFFNIFSVFDFSSAYFYGTKRIYLPFQLDLLEANNQLKTAQQQLVAVQQNNVGPKSGIDEAQRKQIEAQLVQMEEVKKQLDAQAKAIESERKLFEEQR